jgi:hypothetical protein
MRKQLHILKIACFILLVNSIGSLNVTFGQLHNKFIDTVITKLSIYQESKLSTSLFVHFDKTIYADYETVYFTAYLLKTDIDLKSYHTLSVALVRDDNRIIYQEEKYAIHNGISSGSFSIPDTITNGNYSFIVFTNRVANKLPEDVFIQPILIKNADKRVITSLTLIDSLNTYSDSLHVLLKAVDQDNHPLKNTQTDFFVGTGPNQGQKYSLLTNQNGEAIFSTPRKELSNNNNIVHAHLRYNKIPSDVSLILPVYKKSLLVGFYPEGGNLVNSISSLVGWKVKSPEGIPLMVSGLLLEDGKIIDTIQTDGYGMGKFRLTPKYNRRYSVIIAYENYRDTSFQLPTPLISGSVMHISKSVTTDTLQVQVSNAPVSQKMLLLIHDFNELFAAYEVNAKNEIQTFNIPLQKIPRGVSEITLLDNLERPVAERLFFAHFDKRPSLTVISYPGKVKNANRIEIGLKLDSIKDQSSNAIVSIACVQNSRLDNKRTKNIENYLYLDRLLSDIPNTHMDLGNSLEVNEYLEKVLLINGWRRYKWSDLLNINSADTMIRRESLTVSGRILKNGRPVNKSIEFNSIVDSTIGIYKTDNSGAFSLSPEDLVVPPDKRIGFFLNKDERPIYQFEFLDQFHLLNKNIATELLLKNYDLPSNLNSTKYLLLRQDESVHVLDEVTVRARNNGDDDNYFKSTGSMNQNECGDYVCYNNILNCKVHKNDIGNRAPIVGEKYYTKYTSIKTPYFGCNLKEKTHILLYL